MLTQLLGGERRLPNASVASLPTAAQSPMLGSFPCTVRSRLIALVGGKAGAFRHS